MSTTLVPMSYREFKRRVNHNTKILKEALSKDEPLIGILSKLYTYTTKPDELHSSVIIRNAHDMLPAAYLGLLVNVHNNGVDAYEVTKSNEIVFYELKTSEIRSSLVWKGPRGGLNIGDHSDKNKTSAVTSYLSASYSFSTEQIINSKRMKTILLVCDTDGPDGYFDAWELDGDTVVDYYINGRTGQVDIKFGSFMKNGRRSKTVVPLLGIEKWKEQVGARAPTRSIGVY